MAFKVKNSQLNNESLEVLSNLIEMDINATAAFKLSRIIKVITSIVDDKVKSERKIYDKWVVKDSSGNYLHPKDENGNDIKSSVNISDLEGFTKDMSDLMDIENEIPFDKINFEDLQLQTAKIKDLIKVDFLFN